MALRNPTILPPESAKSVESRRTLALSELVLLYTGDSYSAPCPKVRLAVAICERTRPSSLPDLRSTVYGAKADEDVPDIGLERLALGFARWRRNLETV